MKIQIEDYFGNDILILNYKLLDGNRFPYNVDKASIIAEKSGYDLADIDTDEDGDYIRIQQANVDTAIVNEKKDLLQMVSKLNDAFI